MEFLGLLIGALVALAIAVLLSRSDRRRAPPDPEAVDPRRISHLCAALTGDPTADRPILNQILALGPDVIPALLGELTEAHRRADETTPARLARLEDVIADFGLAAVPALTAALARLHPSAPLSPGLVRIMRHLGGPGARASIHRARALPDLAPYLPQLVPRDDPAADAALTAALNDVDPADRRAALDTCAGLIIDRPGALDTLWSRSDPPGRAALLDALLDWLPLATPTLIRSGLDDPAPTVRAAAARLATHATAPPLALPAAALAPLLDDDDPRVRAAAARALAARPDPADRRLLIPAIDDPDPTVSHHARLGRLHGLDPRETAPPEEALHDLDDPDPTRRRLAIHHLGRRRDDPRARERLIRLADDLDPTTRLEAVLALARAGDAITPDLLVRILRAPPPPPDLLGAQEAARRIGPPIAVPLARRLRPDPPDRARALLTVLRAIDYTDAVPPLLRALEDARTGALEGQLSATLHAAGPTARAALDHALRHPARGLLTPALRYLAAYATPADLPLLIDLYDRHPPLRTLVLNIIEAQGAAAIAPLRARIHAGGDDLTLLALEHRLALLEAVTAR